MDTYATMNLKELFEQYALADSDFVKDGVQREIQRRLNAAYGQLDKCRTTEDAGQVFEALLDV